MADKYAAAQKTIFALEDADADKLFGEMDFNGNGICSLAEIDKWVVERWPVLNKKPALMRAYHATIDRDDEEADAWVDKSEFHLLLTNLFVFNKLFDVFADIDRDHDRRIDFAEFSAGAGKLDIPTAERRGIFDAIDTNHGGMILFDEFCIWYARKHFPNVYAHSDAQAAAKPKVKKVVKKVAAVDASADVHTTKFDALEASVLGLAKNPTEVKKIWVHLDGNGNGTVSLAEIDLFVKSKWPLLAHAPALMRAFKATTHTSVVTSATNIKEHHLPALLENLFFFNKLNAVFDDIDSDGDHRLSFPEFMAGLKHVGLKLPAAKAKVVFQQMDDNKGGFVLFDEFCAWVVKQKIAVD